MDTGRQIEWRELFEPGGSDAEMRFRVFSKNGAAFLILPHECRLAARALCLYPAQGGMARIAKSALRAAFGLGAPVPSGAHALQIRASDPFIRFLSRLARCDGPRFAILAGNPRAVGRRFVVLVFGENDEPVAVVKAGAGGEARRLIAHEKSFLESVPATTPGVPRVRDSLVTDRLDAIAFDFIGGDSPRDARGLAPLLSSWVQEELRIPLGGISAFQLLPAESTGPLSEHVVKPVIYHGDFAPWNVKVSGRGGTWTALDWERGELSGVPGWDWFHFTIQPAALVARRNAGGLCRIAEELFNDPAFLDYANKTGIAGIVRPLFCAYLVHCIETVRQTEGSETLLELLRAFRER